MTMCRRRRGRLRRLRFLFQPLALHFAVPQWRDSIPPDAWFFQTIVRSIVEAIKRRPLIGHAWRCSHATSSFPRQAQRSR
jgi:hypothetical protein